MMRSLILLGCAVVAACSNNGDDGTNAAGNRLPDTAEPTLNAAGGPPVTTSGTPATDRDVPAAVQTAAGRIPKLLHGRWGLTPEDCTSTRGDAKGLLVVTADALRFYESRAVPTPGTTTAADSISGDFQFTGEGQQWTRFEALERRPEGLVRTERNPNESFTYARCD